MERILEPELMDDPEQALAYHRADFSASHGRRVAIFGECFPGVAVTGNVLDLGCGSGDVLFRFARAFPGARFIGVDGSAAMLALARSVADANPELAGRVAFVESVLPGTIRGANFPSATIPDPGYALIMSHSLLHHLHNPHVLWETVKAFARPGALIFVADLRRPNAAGDARRIVTELSGEEPEVLQRDFYNSLCAAFTPAEVAMQLQEAGLPELRVAPVGAIHLVIHGVRNEASRPLPIHQGSETLSPPVGAN